MDGFGVTLAFWVLSLTTLGAAAGVFIVRDLFRAVLCLIVAFLGIAGLFILLSADFLGMAQIVIYVGAIAVLILFVLFLTPYGTRNNVETIIAPPAAVVSILFAVVAVFVVTDTDWNIISNPDNAPAGFASTAASLGEALLETWVLPFQIVSVLLTAALVGSIMLVRSRAEEEEDLGE